MVVELLHESGNFVHAVVVGPMEATLSMTGMIPRRLSQQHSTKQQNRHTLQSQQQS